MQSKEIVKDPFNYASILYISAIMLRVFDYILKKEIGVSVNDIL